MRRVCGVGFRLLCGAVLCVGTAAAEPVAMAASPGGGGASGAADPEAAPQARSLYQQGKTAAEAGDWPGAYAAQRAAYARYPHAQIAGALGNAAFALGKYPEAVDMLSQYLDESTDLPAKERADTEERLADAKAMCGTLSIEAPDGSELRVDGAPIGKLPLQKVVHVLPGPHTVEVVLPAGGPVGIRKQVVDVAAGKSARVEVPAGAAETSPATPPAGQSAATTPGPVATQAPAPPTRPSRVPVVVLGTAAGLGVITGGVLMGLSAVREGEARAKLAEYRSLGKSCKEAAPLCQDIDGLWADRDGFGSAALGVWIGSGIAGLAAATVAVVQSRTQPATGTRPPATATTWTPVVSASGAGLVVSGSF